MLERLIEVVKLLALEPAEQLAFFPSFVDVADELATLWGDHYDFLKPDEIARVLGSEASESLRNIGATLAKMDGREACFSRDALATGAEWNSARSAARQLLTRLRIPNTTPMLAGITYVRGKE